MSTKTSEESPGFSHHFWLGNTLAFFSCLVIPFLATFVGEALRVPGLYHRDLKEPTALINWAESLGLWPLFVVLFLAIFPPLAVLTITLFRSFHFKGLPKLKLWFGLLLACGYSLTYWIWWTPWSDPETASGLVWGVFMGIIFPGINGIVIFVLYISKYVEEVGGKENIDSAVKTFPNVQQQSKAKWVWIYNLDSKPIGIWVPQSFLNRSEKELDLKLKMTISAEKVFIEKAGFDADEAGFDLDLYIAFTERRYRIVKESHTEVANNVSFKDGAFLMLGNAKSPSEARNPQAEWEVRDNGGRSDLVPVRR